YVIDAPIEQLRLLVLELSKSPVVESAYLKPAVEPPVRLLGGPTRVDALFEAPRNFEARQLYLADAPPGLGAANSWSWPGGAGAGIQIIDIEGAWLLTHEDLVENQGGLAGGVQIDDVAWRNHGTSVLGILGADRSAIGITGIAYDAETFVLSHSG